MIATLYILIAFWLLAGLAIALAFAFMGAEKLTRGNAPLTLGARLLIIPGAAVLWPLILKRWFAARGSHR